MTAITLTVNGAPVVAEVRPRTSLADFLREAQLCHEVHLGCEHGICGACTILINGKPARSCITYAVLCDGADVETIAGIEADSVMVALREAFTREHALQCGYCTPGMLITARDIVLRHANLSDREIRTELSGNLCRCTGYVGIVRAIGSVMREWDRPGVPSDGGQTYPQLGPAGAPGRPTPALAPVAGIRREDSGEGDMATVPSMGAEVGRRPAITIEQTLTLKQPVDGVWSVFKSIETLAACMPGVELVDAPVGGQAQGKANVTVGPIRTEFLGQAMVIWDDAERQGRVTGHGRDRLTGSHVTGSTGFRLTQGQNSLETNVHLSLSFSIAGPLAQFSRLGLVQSVAQRLMREFAANMERRMTQGTGDVARAKELKALPLLVSAVRDWTAGVLRRLFR